LRSLLALLIVTALGCAGVQHERSPQQAAASLEQARTGKRGVCAGIGNIPGDPWSADPRAEPKPKLGSEMVGATVEACARTGSDGRALLDVMLSFPIYDERWKGENWHVEVIRKDGLVIHAGGLPEGRLASGGCLLDTCLQEDHVTLQLDEPWRADAYRIRLRHVPTRTRADLTIALQ